jgi:hypothetical protein
MAAFLSSIGMVLLMTQPELIVAFAAGAVLQIGGAAAGLEPEIDTSYGPIKKDALEEKVFILEKSLDTDQLKSQIQSKADSLSGADGEFANSIIAEHDSFDNLYQKHFEEDVRVDHAKIAAAKAAFNDYVNKA